MEHCDVKGVVLQRVERYLEKLGKLVNFHLVCADIVCRVLQRSILGSKLFILYIKDICKASDILHFILFADDTDDTTTYCIRAHSEQILKIVTQEMIQLKTWFDKTSYYKIWAEQVYTRAGGKKWWLL